MKAFVVIYPGFCNRIGGPINDHHGKIWNQFRLSRREFLRRFGIASGAITFSPFFLDRFSRACAQGPDVKVFLVKNGDHMQNTAKIWQLAGGTSRYIASDDVVIIKCNGQWPDRGYTHTGCVKGVIDKILEIPGFSGEIHICDNVQTYGSAGEFGFDATPGKRTDNWPDHNWNSLAAAYQAAGKPVATKRWYNEPSTGGGISGPAEGEGWVREFFSHHDIPAFLSYPIYDSPITGDYRIDPKHGAWSKSSGQYLTDRKVVVLFLPTLNYHSGYAGITGAVKCFFGSTEIHGGIGGKLGEYYQIHSATYQHAGNSENTNAYRAGELTARYMHNQYAPSLFITCAMYSGHDGRWSSAVETKTVLACTNPASLDYIACKQVISPLRGDSVLDPDIDQPVRRQLLGCADGGVGTIDPARIELVQYDFDNPSATRIDIDNAILDLKSGGATTETDVKNLIREYMETP